MNRASAAGLSALALAAVLVPLAAPSPQDAEPAAVPAAVRSVLDARCVDCHKGSSAPQGLKLDAKSFPASALDVASKEVPEKKILDTASPDDSYLLAKIEGAPGIQGRRMPPTGPLPDETIAQVKRWVESLKKSG